MASISEDYDPYKFRQIENPLTNLEAFINLIKSFIGSGLLAMPMAFYNSGWIVGLIGTGVITFLLIYAMHLLLNGMYILCKWERVPELIYSEAMGAAFKRGPHCFQLGQNLVVYLTDFFLSFFHFGILAVYVVFLADNTKEVVEDYLPSLDIRIYMVLLTVPLILIFSIRDLKHLVPFSATANVLIFLGICFVLYYVFSALGPFSELKNVQNIELLPLFFGAVLFAMEAPGVVVALEANMANPQDYLGPFGILSIGMIIVSLLYALMGLFGYWRYGNEVKGSVTLNIPEKDILPLLVKCMFILAIFFSYPLQGYVTIDILCHRYIFKHLNPEKQHKVEYFLRVIVVLLSVFSALCIPQLGLFLSLIGSMCLSVLGLIFPALMDICIKYAIGYGPMRIHLIKDVLIFFFGLAGGISGTAIAIKDIITTYTK